MASEYYNQRLIRHIEKYPDFNWNWSQLSRHMDLNELVIQKYKDKPWNWKSLANHENFNFGWVKATMDKPWNWTQLSLRVTMKDVLENRNRKWRWRELTVNKNITFDDIIENPTLPWHFHEIGLYNLEQVDIKFLKFFRNKFNMDDWSAHTYNASWTIIKNNLDLPWDTSAIRFHKGDICTQDDINILVIMDDVDWDRLSIVVPFSLIKANRKLPWVWRNVSKNSTLTHHDIVAMVPLDYNLVPLEPISEFSERWFAAKRIQRCWRRCIADPSYVACRNRLLIEFRQMNSNG